ncbi:MAG: adenosine kinase [Firmicutes bacterium]|nr:adenosine kinase [Bacillota bacterium]
MDYDVLVVGNPLMDQLVFVEDEVLKQTGVEPGSMSLIDMPDIARLAKLTNGAVMASGGSETNTAVGIAEFGGTVKLLGALADDDIGKHYQANLDKYSNLKVDFDVYPSAEYGVGTGISLVFVSPNGERTMLTYLGASTLLEDKSIDKVTADTAKAVYFDGYILDLAAGNKITQKLLSYARASQAKIVFGLADVNVVARHHEAILDLVTQVDILLANEAEINSLTGADNPHEAVEIASKHLSQIAVTLGAQGALVYDDGLLLNLNTPEVSAVIDTTGAGDQFAAGICFGVARGISLKDSALLGMKAASEVIAHMGARPTAGWAESFRSINYNQS